MENSYLSDHDIRLLYGGKVVRSFREKAGKGSKDLALLLGCQQPTLSNIENGTRPLATKVTPEALGKALNLTSKDVDKLRLLYSTSPCESEDYDLLSVYYEIINDWLDPTGCVEKEIRDQISLEHVQHLIDQNHSLFERYKSEAFDLILRPLLKSSQFDQAIDAAKNAISHHNEKSYISYIDLHNNLAECYLRKAFYYENQYEREWLYLIRSNPKVIKSQSSNALETLEDFRHMALENFKASLNALNKVMIEIKSDIHILNQLALTHYNIGKLLSTSDSTWHLNKAVEFFDKVIQARHQSLIDTPSKANVNKGTFKRCIAFKSMALAYLGKTELAHELLSVSANACLPSEESAFWSYVNAIIYCKSKMFSETSQHLMLADNLYELSSQQPDKPGIVGFFTRLALQEPELQDFLLHLMQKNSHVHKLMCANSLSLQEIISVKMAIENER